MSRSPEQKTEAMKNVWIEYWEKAMAGDDGVLYVPSRMDMVAEFVEQMMKLAVTMREKGARQ